MKRLVCRLNSMNFLECVQVDLNLSLETYKVKSMNNDLNIIEASLHRLTLHDTINVKPFFVENELIIRLQRNLIKDRFLIIFSGFIIWFWFWFLI